MKRKVLLFSILGLLAVCSSCNKDDDDDTKNAADLDYNSTNSASWQNYMINVAALLKNDATTLYDSWNTSYENGAAYATTFKTYSAPYTDATSCVEQIVDGCIDIAGEVGGAKIGDPYNLYVEGKTTEALYAVESWYSWHSRDDYSNNIRSIRNAYFGSRDGSISENSLSVVIEAVNHELDSIVKANITTTINAIQAIPQPFRDNISSEESETAMDACSNLETVLDNLKSFVIKEGNGINETDMQDVVSNYVDNVVLPTYKDLKEANETLYDKVVAFKNSPSNEAFETACNAWLDAREPWESSEAFLFGPVDALGLDPNMDSWPLDQDAIVQLLESGDYANMEWTDGDSEEAVESAQSVRGFHTLEYLLFKNGEPRVVD